MNFMLKQKRVLFFIFIAVFVVILITHQTPFSSQNNTTPSPKTNLKASWQLFNTQNWIFSAQTPQVQTYLKAKQIQYQKAQQYSTLYSPYIIETRPDTQLTLSSQLAHSKQTHHLTFLKQVIIHQYLQATQNKTLRSEEISYNIQTEEITSPVLVTLTQKGIKTSGVGFKANGKQKNLYFSSKVTTYYDPNVLKQATAQPISH